MLRNVRANDKSVKTFMAKDETVIQMQGEGNYEIA